MENAANNKQVIKIYSVADNTNTHKNNNREQNIYNTNN